MSANDLVIAAASGYAWADVAPWALSLVQSGFQGEKIVIAYEGGPHARRDPAVRKELIEELDRLGFRIALVKLKGSIFNQRFADLYRVLAPMVEHKRYAIATDIRDVVFQSDPSVWLEQHLQRPLYAVSEGIAFRHETWNRENVALGFPDLAPRVMDHPVYNVGILAGEARAVADLCLAIGLVAKASRFDIADQSGYNLLLDLEPFRQTVHYGLSEDGFCCQAGVLADPTKREAYLPHLLEPTPVLDGNTVKTAGGRAYAMVHQYDRVPAWRDALRARIARASAPRKALRPVAP